MSSPLLQLRSVKTEVLAAATPSALAAAVNGFCADAERTSRSLVSLSFETLAGASNPYLAYLVFTE